ncbi:MAG: Crp/Fnr family transcriptional regulator [Gammaproteobacteria bacterium]|nr:Crp/Fnr family transcriptional regulator [Gammaproteobacteria bacterium]
MIEQATPLKNRLLNCMPLELQSRLIPKLKMMSLEQGSVVHEAGASLTHVYFPIDSIISLLHVLENGTTAEVSVIGNEGMIGVSVFMGGNNAQNQAIALTTGTVFQMSAIHFRDEFNQPDAVFRMLLLRYSQALITQMAQTVVCNRHHSIEQQLSRWLLMASDRLPHNDIIMTHELIASMLGVRREGITASAHKLKEVGAIDYHRGHIMIVDRIKLEKMSCECYLVVKRETDRLLPCHSVESPESVDTTSNWGSMISSGLHAKCISRV